MKKIIIIFISLLLLGKGAVYGATDSQWADNQSFELMQILDLYDENISKITFKDMPENILSRLSIAKLNQWGIVKGYDGKIFPQNYLNRYEFALLINRIIHKFNIIKNPSQKKVKTNFVDKIDDNEFLQALEFLSNNEIMKGYSLKGKQYFGSMENLNGEAALAVLGRMIFGLEDSKQGNWYDSYINKYKELNIILDDWVYIGKPITREEIFKLIVLSIKVKGISN